MTDFTENLNLPIPTASISSKRLADIQAVRAAIVAMDLTLSDLLNGAGGVSMPTVQAAIDAAMTDIKGGVLPAGDTLGKLYNMIKTLQDADLDDVVEVASYAALPGNGLTGTLYVTTDNNLVFRWTGTVYINITSAGVKSVNGYTDIVELTKSDLGLGGVDNTSDADKPVSAAQQTAINAAQAAAASDATTKANAAQAASAPLAHVGSTGAAHGDATGSVAGFMSATDKTKLDSITGTNTGDQTSVTGNAGTATKLATARNINGVPFDGTQNITITSTDSVERIAVTEKGVADGVATLDGSGKVPSSQLPSFVDDVIEATDLAALPLTGETGKIYLALDTNKAYRWSGSTYVYITSGAVDSIAGKTGVVTLVKADVGLNNVDNTSDVNKPVSTAQQTAIDAAVTTAAGDATTKADAAQAAAQAASAPLAHVGVGGTEHSAATPSEAGFLSAADKAKLDSLQIIVPTYDIALFYAGAPPTTGVVLRFKTPRVFTLPVGLTNSTAICGVNSTATTVFSIRKNGIQIGTLTFIVNNPTGSFAFAVEIAFAAGDVIEIIAPVVPDATLADISITLVPTV